MGNFCGDKVAWGYNSSILLKLFTLLFGDGP